MSSNPERSRPSEDGQVTAEYTVGTVGAATVGMAILVIAREPGFLETIQQVIEMGWQLVRDEVFMPLGVS